MYWIETIIHRTEQYIYIILYYIVPYKNKEQQEEEKRVQLSQESVKLRRDMSNVEVRASVEGIVLDLPKVRILLIKMCYIFRNMSSTDLQTYFHTVKSFRNHCELF